MFEGIFEIVEGEGVGILVFLRHGKWRRQGTCLLNWVDIYLLLTNCTVEVGWSHIGEVWWEKFGNRLAAGRASGREWYGKAGSYPSFRRVVPDQGSPSVDELQAEESLGLLKDLVLSLACGVFFLPHTQLTMLYEETRIPRDVQKLRTALYRP